jgi:hypothetical protein
MCKVHFIDSEMGYRTLGHLVKVNYDDKDLFINYLQERLGLFTDAYTTYPINSIHFSYIIKDGVIVDDTRTLFKDNVDQTITTHRFNNKNIPISMDPNDYGKILVSNTVDSFTRYIVSDGSRTYQIDQSLDQMTNKVLILGSSKFGWTDTKLEIGFMREIGKSTIYFADGEIILQKQERPAKPLKNSFLNKNKNIKIIIYNNYYIMILS